MSVDPWNAPIVEETKEAPKIHKPTLVDWDTLVDELLAVQKAENAQNRILRRQQN